MADYVLIGVGQAGSAIVDEMFSHKYLPRIARGIAVNSTMKDLMNLKNIPRQNWLGISPKKGLIGGKEPGFEEHVIGGFGKDPRRAMEIMERNFGKLTVYLEDFFHRPDQHFLKTGSEKKSPGVVTNKNADDLESQVDDWIAVDEEGNDVGGSRPDAPVASDNDLGVGHVPFALVVLGLGGGTGSGASATLIRAIRKISQVDTTVIVVGILPATHEHGLDQDGGDSSRGAMRQAWNTRWALNELEKVADGIILVDNERLSFAHNVESLFPKYNNYIATALRDLLGGVHLEEIKMKKHGEVSLPVVDIQDIVSAISFTDGAGTRTPGYAAMGRAVELTHRFPGYIVPFLGRREVDPVALLKLSLMKRSIAGNVPDQARKNLAQVRLPPSFMRSADSFPATGRVEEELGRLSDLGETHFGITLTKRRLVSVTALMTYRREDLERLVTIDRLADRYEERVLVEAI